MTSPPAFLFDLDGTLADTLPDIAASTNHLRRRHGLGPLAADVVRGYVGDGARALLRRALADVLPASPRDQDALLARAHAEYVEHHRAQCTVQATLFAGAGEHLATLRAKGHAVAVVTNKPAQFAVPLVRHLGLHEVVSVVVGGDTLPQRKPDPAPLRHALMRLEQPVAGATMVGDGLQDLRAGKALGVRTIACLFGYGDAAALRREGADVFWRAFAVSETT